MDHASLRADENAQRRFSDKNWAIIDTLVAVADDEGRSPASAALGWLLAKPWVSAPIVGANRPDQLQDAVVGLDRPLSAESLARLDEVSDFERSRVSLEI